MSRVVRGSGDIKDVEYAVVGLLMEVDNIETTVIQKFDNVDRIKNVKIGDYIYMK